MYDMSDVIKKLEALQPMCMRECGDGDGRVDSWAEHSPDGEYFSREDVEAVIEWLRHAEEANDLEERANAEYAAYYDGDDDA